MSHTAALSADHGLHLDGEADAPSIPTPIRLLGLDFDALSQAEALRLIAARPAGAPFAYVVTPNADHLVRLARNPATYQPLYDGAWLRLLDSRVVVRLARLFGLPVPPVVTGSDLTAALVRKAAATKEPVSVLGLTEEETQALALHTGLRIRHYCPPRGFESDTVEMAKAVRFVETNPTRLVFLAVGSPRQEMMARVLVARGVATGTGLCVGASLHYLAGIERRAPILVQRAGMEWAWRLAQNPKRLWRRYLVDDPEILRLLWREARSRR
jgi:N-acetylglucosaminyldiphosphoundecaprenol N-acetyl-beta-D-mannosaminyltransferase